MTVADALLTALGLLALGAGVRVVGTAHLVRAGLWLIVTLAAIAGMYLVLGAELVAWVQVLLYVGAVVVLLLFAVMLTRAPIGVSIDMDRPRFTGALIGGGAGLGLAALLIDAYHWTFVRNPPTGTAEDIGTAVFRTWGLPFEVVSVLLLAALVGAIVVSRPAGDTVGRDAVGRDTLGGDAMGRDTVGRDAMGRDTVGGPVGGISMSGDPAGGDRAGDR